MTGCGTQEGATYDEYEKEYCDEQFDLSDDKKKVEEKKFADLVCAVAESEDGTVTTKEQIDALEEGMSALGQECCLPCPRGGTQSHPPMMTPSLDRLCSNQF